MSAKSYKENSPFDSHIGIIFRVYPTEEQKKTLRSTFNAVRFFWNKMLEEYNNSGEVKDNPVYFKKEHPWLYKSDSMAFYGERDKFKAAIEKYEDMQFKIQPKLKKLNKEKDREKYEMLLQRGKPKFKTKKNPYGLRCSYRTVCSHDNIKIFDDSIKIPKLKKPIKAIIHRLPSQDVKISNATISEDATGQWYISIGFSFVSPEEIKETKVKILENFENLDENIIEIKDKFLKNIDDTGVTHVGLDYTMDGLYIDSFGNSAEMPKFFDKTKDKLAKAQSTLRGMAEGSNNYRKQQNKIARLHKKTGNQRDDFLKKEASALSKKYMVISCEDLDMRSYARRNKKTGKKRYGKSVAETCFGKFRTLLEQQQEKRGHFLVKVDKFFPSSQTCHSCGYQNTITKDLKIREIVCPNCGTAYNRDVNAAKNIDVEGLRVLFALKDRHGTGRICDENHKTPSDCTQDVATNPATLCQVEAEAPTSVRCP